MTTIMTFWGPYTQIVAYALSWSYKTIYCNLFAYLIKQPRSFGSLCIFVRITRLIMPFYFAREVSNILQTGILKWRSTCNRETAQTEANFFIGLQENCWYVRQHYLYTLRNSNFAFKKLFSLILAKISETQG